MAFNKSRALESALKYLNQGKVAQAIGEYQQILRHDAKDQATLMTVGDLFARQGDMPQAIEYFERLAQVYLSDGFNSKAIAIYKKIAKLAPAELAPLERLADLYVQQGVLSEARPLFLQIAEAHLKANRAPKAVEVLHRLLEIEPENPRVQMRLAELYNVMGQKKEAAQTYFNYAQRQFEHGETGEAEKLIERALEVDPGNAASLLLKAKILAAGHKAAEAITILSRHPDVDTGEEVTHLLVDLELKSGHVDKAADRARNQLARGSSHFDLLETVTESLLEGGEPRQALPLLKELRDPLVEAGEQDKYINLLSSAAEKLAGDPEPLEMLADFSRHSSDPFHLNSALNQLVDVYAAAGNYSRAEELLQEMIDRNKNDERLVIRLDELRAQARGKAPKTEAKPPVHEEIRAEVQAAEPAIEIIPEKEAPAAASILEEAPPAPARAADDTLDEETQRYVAQALTDVDLFSSYGLTQKATHLLENVLQRAPRHTPTLERLLDFYLGAGNERRTAELAALLEQIHRERQDTVNAERFAELRQRFQAAAGLPAEELPPSSPVPVAPEPVVAEASVQAAPVPVEFEVPVTAAEQEPAAAPSPTAAPAAKEPEAVAAAPEVQPAAAHQEVDLSDEWEAMVQEVAEPPQAAAPAPEEPAAPEPMATQEEAIELEISAEPEAAPVEGGAPQQTIELVEPAAEEPAPVESAPSSEEFELELTPEPAAAQAKAGPTTTEDFLSELASEVEDMQTPSAQPAAPAAPPHAPVKSAPDEAVVAAAGSNGASSGPVPEPTAESLNQLAEVFQEFRSELGEMGDEDEDLETHYNLGIAYREMGLLDEAIGEFQKVAKAVQKGKPFAYAMNCSTLLALSFMEKGEPKIAALWYQKALEVPGLDQETVVALRYDLGVALDMAGESTAALDSFRQVYASNIDYRDVADRIATLQKA